MSPLLNTADALYVGSTRADAGYLGSTQVWAGTDPDAAAFLTAATITDPTISTAVGTLVTDLKTASLWTKLHALWPFVGGTASTHKWNLKDPRDLDAAYRLTFNGGYTHDANGITPDGASAYADTHLVDTVMTPTSGSFGIYVRTNHNPIPTSYDMGASNVGDTQASIAIARYSSGLTYLCYGTAAYAPSTSSSDARGFWATNRNGASNTEGYKNGSKIIDTADTVSLSGVSFYLTASHRGSGPAYYGERNLALAFVADGLTSGQQASLYTAIQAFQTTLGRQV